MLDTADIVREAIFHHHAVIYRDRRSKRKALFAFWTKDRLAYGLIMNPNKRYETIKKAHGNSREVAVRRRTARKAIEAHSATIRTSERRTGTEAREYLP